MIQRKQTIWLLLAAICSACLFFVDFYHAHVNVNGTDTITYLRVNDHYPSLLMVLVMAVLPFIDIFMYKNRKRQRALAIVSIVANAGFVSMMLSRVTNFNKTVPAPTDGTYWIGAILPLISMLFLILAISGINKDEKLIKSLDRLR